MVFNPFRPANASAAWTVPIDEWLEHPASREYLAHELSWNVALPLAVALLLLLVTAASGCCSFYRQVSKAQPYYANTASRVAAAAAIVALAWTGYALGRTFRHAGDVADTLTAAETDAARWLCEAPPSGECCAASGRPTGCARGSLLGVTRGFAANISGLASGSLRFVNDISPSALVPLQLALDEYDALLSASAGLGAALELVQSDSAQADSSLQAAQAAGAAYASHAAWKPLSEALATLVPLPSAVATNVTALRSGLSSEVSPLQQTLTEAQAALDLTLQAMPSQLASLNGTVFKQTDEVDRFLSSAFSGLATTCSLCVHAWDLSRFPALGAPLVSCPAAQPTISSWEASAPLVVLGALVALCVVAALLLLRAALCGAKGERSRSRCCSACCATIVVPVLMALAAVALLGGALLDGACASGVAGLIVSTNIHGNLSLPEGRSVAIAALVDDAMQCGRQEGAPADLLHMLQLQSSFNQSVQVDSATAVLSDQLEAFDETALAPLRGAAGEAPVAQAQVATWSDMLFLTTGTSGYVAIIVRQLLEALPPHGSSNASNWIAFYGTYPPNASMATANRNVRNGLSDVLTAADAVARDAAACNGTVLELGASLEVLGRHLQRGLDGSTSIVAQGAELDATLRRTPTAVLAEASQASSCTWLGDSYAQARQQLCGGAKQSLLPLALGLLAAAAALAVGGCSLTLRRRTVTPSLEILAEYPRGVVIDDVVFPSEPAHAHVLMNTPNYPPTPGRESGSSHARVPSRSSSFARGGALPPAACEPLLGLPSDASASRSDQTGFV